MSDDFDRWLDDELGATLTRAAGPAAVPADPRYLAVGRRSATWRRRLPILSGVPLALSAKVVAAFAAAALATGNATANPPTPSIAHPTANAGHPTPSAGHPTPSAVHPTPPAH